MKNLLITCGLPYSNGNLHVGHIAGCYLPADIYVRWQRLNGRNVRFICGSDDHGVPIKLSADKEGVSPSEISRRFNQNQKTDFIGLGINFDIYGQTANNEIHRKTSQDFFLKLYEQGYFKKKSSAQYFDPKLEMFLPDRYVKGVCAYCQSSDQNSDQCENCGKELDVTHLLQPYSVINNHRTAVALKETFHWYLDLAKFESKVDSWLKNSFIREHTKSFVQGLIGTGLVERSMTRDLDWGIPLPELKSPDGSIDSDTLKKVLYVWFDAPIGYISNTKTLCANLENNQEAYTDWWKSKDTEIYHFIGEDNTIFHCVIWIAMLSAEGSFQLPTGVIVNQFLNFQKPGSEVEKISKSRGTAVWIRDYLDSGQNPDSLRYYLTTIAPERARTVFSEEDLKQKHNSELANTLGNFVNRVLSFYLKHYGASIPAPELNPRLSTNQDFESKRQNLASLLSKELENFNFKNAQEELFNFIRSCNVFIDQQAPWTVKKTDPDRAQLILLDCIHAIFTIAVCLQAFLPFTAEKIFRMLNIEANIPWSSAGASLPATEIQTLEILFQKIE